MNAQLRLLPVSALVALLAVSSAAPVRADESAEAKAHYQKAMAHYAVGEYREAASEYESAYKAKQDPALLYNAAQSHRLANDNQKALLLYKNIVKLYPTSKYAAESKDRIEKLEQAIATTQSPPNQPAPMGATSPPTGTAPPPGAPPVQPLGQPAPGAAVPAVPPPAASPAPAATLTATSSPPPEADSPIYKKWWFWAGAGALVVAGVVTAVALSSGGSGTWSNLDEVKGTVRR